MNNSLLILAEHSARTLPDSISERKKILRAINNVLPDRHPASADVRGQLATLDAMDKLQEQLLLKFNRGGRA